MAGQFDRCSADRSADRDYRSEQPTRYASQLDRPERKTRAIRLGSQWFNTSAFINPPTYTFGNVGRVLPDVRNPGVINVDLSVIKDFSIRENANLQFRAQSFNVANHVNLGFPTTLPPSCLGRMALTIAVHSV